MVWWWWLLSRCMYDEVILAIPLLSADADVDCDRATFSLLTAVVRSPAPLVPQLLAHAFFRGRNPSFPEAADVRCLEDPYGMLAIG